MRRVWPSWFPLSERNAAVGSSAVRPEPERKPGSPFRSDEHDDGIELGDGYDLDDPKSTGYHDRMVSIWDDRDKTEGR